MALWVTQHYMITEIIFVLYLASLPSSKPKNDLLTCSTTRFFFFNALCFRSVCYADDKSELFDALLASTDYDLRDRPTPLGKDFPVPVLTSVYVYFLGHIEEETLEFEAHLMIR